jgi:hypothetical protein
MTMEIPANWETAYLIDHIFNDVLKAHKDCSAVRLITPFGG